MLKLFLSLLLVATCLIKPSIGLSCGDYSCGCVGQCWLTDSCVQAGDTLQCMCRPASAGTGCGSGGCDGNGQCIGDDINDKGTAPAAGSGTAGHQISDPDVTTSVSFSKADGFDYCGVDNDIKCEHYPCLSFDECYGNDCLYTPITDGTACVDGGHEGTCSIDNICVTPYTDKTIITLEGNIKYTGEVNIEDLTDSLVEQGGSDPGFEEGSTTTTGGEVDLGDVNLDCVLGALQGPNDCTEACELFTQEVLSPAFGTGTCSTPGTFQCSEGDGLCPVLCEIAGEMVPCPMCGTKVCLYTTDCREATCFNGLCQYVAEQSGTCCLELNTFTPGGCDGNGVCLTHSVPKECDGWPPQEEPDTGSDNPPAPDTGSDNPPAPDTGSDNDFGNCAWFTDESYVKISVP